MKNSGNSKKTNIHREIDSVKTNYSETRQENDTWELELLTIDNSEALNYQGGGRPFRGGGNAQAIMLPTDYSRLADKL